MPNTESVDQRTCMSHSNIKIRANTKTHNYVQSSEKIITMLNFYEVFALVLIWHANYKEHEE